MKRFVVAAACAALLLVVLPTSVDAGAAAAGNVSVVHGLGDEADENPVDVYVRETGSGDQFALTLEDVGYGSISELGSLPAGDYDVLLCEAVPDPLELIDDCSDNEASSINGISGNVASVPAAEQVVLFAGIGASTRPEVLVFVPDLSCVEGATNGRATAAHAADAGTVTVSVAGTPVIEGLVNGDTAALDVPAGSYDVNVTDGELLDLDATLEVTALQNTMAYVTGDPDMEDDYTVLTQSFAVEPCPVETTTTTAAPQPATSPRFTG